MDILPLLLAAVIIVALFQPTDERLFAGSMFAITSAIHYIAFYNIDGIAYYGSAALTDLAVIFLTIRLRIISKTIEHLQNICVVSILLNGIGWVVWMLYLPPDVYNTSFIILYSAAIITLLRKDESDADGAYKLGRRHHNIRPFSD